MIDKIEKELNDLKKRGEAPDFMDIVGYKTLLSGYLLPNETPKGMYRRVAHAAASYYTEDYEDRFFNMMWKNWLCPSTPVLSNMGTNRGLPISCLAGDTWLNTKCGGIQIQDIKIGDEVLTHEGRYRKVINKQSRFSNGDLFKIKVATRLTPMEITGNHPLLTNLGWVRVDQLDPKIHFIATNHFIEYSENPYVIDMKKYVDYEYLVVDNLICKKSTNKLKRKQTKNGVVDNYAKIPEFIEVTEDLAWALGLWFAEGSKAINRKKIPNSIRITMGLHEQKYIKKWIDIMQNSFNINGNSYTSEATREDFANGKTTKWASGTANSIVVGKFFTEEFGLNCKIKTLPEWLIDLPKVHLLKFLEGLFLGDAYKVHNVNTDDTYSITLSNPKLLLGIYNICLKLDIPVSLQMQKKPSKIGKTKYTYALRTLVKNSIKLSRYNVDTGIVFNKLRYCPILMLEKLNYDKEVYDITIDEDSSFSASGVVVHNCNSIHVDDSLDSIFMKNYELAMLSKNGAGVGIFFGDIRGRGVGINGNGKSEGVIPWCKVMDTTTVSVSQGSTRRGASAIYLPIEHLDINEFINIRRPTGDVNRRCLNINHGITISDSWMESMLSGDKEKRKLWEEILKNRVETGEPYLFFSDNVNKNNPECYVKNNLNVKTSNICSEIVLYTDPDHSFVCCLSSLNLVRWEEWKDTDTVNLAVRFLDAVLSEYIKKTETMKGMEASRRSAIKGRAIGIGVLGWHTLLQERGLPFDSFDTMQLNAEIFKSIHTKANQETEVLAKELGEPEWCKGFNRRNTHLLAVAPTVSNSTISGGHSAGIEPISANVFVQKSAKGTFIRKNKTLEKLLEAKNKNTTDVWKSINEQSGSVQHLEFLTLEEKEVYLTAREINQHTIVKLAVQRQKWVDQAQSVNLFFAMNSSPKYIHEVHLAAWKNGLKTLYYLRSDGVIKSDLASRTEAECKACEG